MLCAPIGYNGKPGASQASARRSEPKQETAGVAVPELRAIGKAIGRLALKEPDRWPPLLRLLWDEYGREGRVITLIPLGVLGRQNPEAIIPLLREMCRSCVTWEDADRLAMNGLEPAVRAAPDQWMPLVTSWLTDENKWVRRAAATVVGRLPMKQAEWTGRCLALIEPLTADPEAVVRKNGQLCHSPGRPRRHGHGARLAGKTSTPGRRGLYLGALRRYSQHGNQTLARVYSPATKLCCLGGRSELECDRPSLGGKRLEEIGRYMIKEIGTLVWDLDGTLAFRADGWTGALLQVLQLEGIKAQLEQLRPYLAQGFPWQHAHIPHPTIRSADHWWEQVNAVLARALQSGADLTPQAANSLAQAVRRIYLEPSAWQRFPDALSSLEELTQRGWRHVLLSNHVPELRQLLAGLDLTPHFACILNSAETGYEKPHPQAFQLALDACVADRPVWMIGDNFHADIIGAEWVGIPGILVHTSDPLAERQVNNLAELSSLL